MSSDVEKWKFLPEDHLARSKSLPWYIQTFEHKLSASFRKLLEEWGSIPPDDVIPHIYRVREQAWQIFPWPCIGEVWFIEQGLLRHPSYPQIIQHLHAPPSLTKPSPKFLDLGTCLGQDLRTLAHAGIPTSTLYGTDILPNFFTAGYTLFRDSDRLPPSHFITGDIFSSTDSLAQTCGSWTIIHVCMFLHIFSLVNQERACVNIIKLLHSSPGL